MIIKGMLGMSATVFGLFMSSQILAIIIMGIKLNSKSLWIKVIVNGLISTVFTSMLFWLLVVIAGSSSIDATLLYLAGTIFWGYLIYSCIWDIKRFHGAAIRRCIEAKNGNIENNSLNKIYR